MAKKKVTSKHSRAARRATPPGINTDPSLKDASLPLLPPSSGAERPSVLAVHRSAGVQKKTRRVRKSRLSARARRRHERGLEMAEAVGDRTSAKIARSVGKVSVTQARRKTWDEVNRAVGDVVPARNAFEALAREGDGGDRGSSCEDKAWETDEDMEVAAAGQQMVATATAVPVPVPAAAAAAAAADDDEIL